MFDKDTQDWFKRKAALVTGAAQGVGREIALQLGRAGAKVGVNYRTSEREAHAACEVITRDGGSAIALSADLSRPDEVQAMFSRFHEHFGARLDMLVNNAGQWMDKTPIVNCPLELWERMIDVNAKSVFLCCQHAARLMKDQQSGSIVNIGSLAGHTGGGGGTVPYAAAKAAVHTFTRGLAREMAPFGVRVNAVAPGMVDTPMIQGRVSEQAAQQLKANTPLNRFAAPAEIVPAVMFLLSPAASFITGSVIEVNGGLLMR